jgi:hypothetical protein
MGTKKGLSSLDVFGLISGLIGLVADVISLSALFGLTQANLSIPTSSWVTSLILIFYTSIVVGFYSRRILCHINRKKLADTNLDTDTCDRIEKAATIIGYVITATLCLMFIYSIILQVFISIDQYADQKLKAANIKIEQVKEPAKPQEQNDIESREIRSIEGERYLGKGVSVFLTVVATCVLAFYTNYISKLIYEGCDPDYEASWRSNQLFE